MSFNNETILLGYSGHGFVVAEACLLAKINISGYSEKRKLALNPFNLDYLGFEMDDDFQEWETSKNYVLGIGDNHIRHKVGMYVQSRNRQVLNIIHPAASITKMLTIGSGNFISRNVAINPLVEIGSFCIINTGAIIEHECIIGDAVHIAPGAVLAGNVEVGANTFIGANSVVKQGVKIGENVIIGAGSVILKDIDNNVKVVGNPGRIL